MDIRIPITKPWIDDRETEAVASVLRSGWVTQGKAVERFEQRVAEYVGAPEAVATSSCTTALHLALILAGVEPGDEVILPSLSYIGTANPVLYQHAVPVFSDVDPRTFNLDPAGIEEKITPKTRAILLVHQFGLPGDLEPFFEIARHHGLRLIQDAACALGAAHQGKRIGGQGEISCFSFHPRKIITTGEGGMIVSGNQLFCERARRLRSLGASVSDLDRHQAGRVILERFPEAGFNYRMTDLQAAMGLAQMDKLDEIIRKRRERALRYTERLREVRFIVLPEEPSYAFHPFQSYCVRIREDSPVTRDAVMETLLDKGIATRRGCMAIHREPCYQEPAARARLPVTELLERTTLLLPLFPDMTLAMQDEVVDRLGRMLGWVEK